MKFSVFLFFGMSICFAGFTQAWPDKTMNISNLTTYGRMALASCGDDDFSQTIFINVTGDTQKEFYIRIFDPDCGGKHDMRDGRWETNTSFSVYGGVACITDTRARGVDPEGFLKSGVKLSCGIFAEEEEWDDSWFTFGPFLPDQGEQVEGYPGHFFKLIVEGKTGNDGNLYSVFVSQQENENTEPGGIKFFQFEYTFSPTNDPLGSRFSSYVSPDITAMEIGIFGMDNFGDLHISHFPSDANRCSVSADPAWDMRTIRFNEGTEEKLDMHIVRKDSVNLFSGALTINFQPSVMERSGIFLPLAGQKEPVKTSVSVVAEPISE